MIKMIILPKIKRVFILLLTKQFKLYYQIEAFANYFDNDKYFNLDITGVSIEDKENTKIKFYANTLVEYEVSRRD